VGVAGELVRTDVDSQGFSERDIEVLGVVGASLPEPPFPTETQR
jgi:hypothetical protein